MPVLVKIAGPRPDKVEHAAGEDIVVDDSGALIVTAREGRAERVVAAYAEGCWFSAEVLDPA